MTESSQSPAAIKRDKPIPTPIPRCKPSHINEATRNNAAAESNAAEIVSARASLDELRGLMRVKRDRERAGKDGVLFPGIAVGKVVIDDNKKLVNLFADPDQINFVSVALKQQEDSGAR